MPRNQTPFVYTRMLNNVHTEKQNKCTHLHAHVWTNSNNMHVDMYIDCCALHTLRWSVCSEYSYRGTSFCQLAS